MQSSTAGPSGLSSLVSYFMNHIQRLVHPPKDSQARMFHKSRNKLTNYPRVKCFQITEVLLVESI